MLKVEEKIQKYIYFLNPQEKNINKILIQLLQKEYRRRLTRYENVDRALQQKYGVSFNKFNAKNIVKERGFSWEVESDAMLWEQAIDGIKTMRRKLDELNTLK